MNFMYIASIFSSGSPIRNIRVSTYSAESAAIQGLRQGGNGVEKIEVVRVGEPSDKAEYEGSSLHRLRALI